MSQKIPSNKDKDKTSIKTTNRNIFHSSGSVTPEEIDQNQLQRKRSERHASQGVKLLINREKGINEDSNASYENDLSPVVMIYNTSNSIQNDGKKVFQGYPVITNTSVDNNNMMISNNNNFSNQVNLNNSVQSTMNSNIIHTGIHPLNSSGIQYYRNPQTSARHSHSKEDKIINRANFEKILIEKLRKEGLDLKNINEITNFVNIGIESYLKNLLEKLISISRSRNVNLNLYSKQSEKNPIFKIHTYNFDKQAGGTNTLNIQNHNQMEIAHVPYKEFSILFTKNVKNTLSMMEQYEELTLKKLRQERVSLYKSKLEEISALKEQEKLGTEKEEKKMPTESTKTGTAKPRVRKRDSMLKSVRNTLAKSQKRDEMARHKKATQNTLETFLDNKPRLNVNTNLSTQRFDTEMVSNVGESHNLETYTKMSEMSKSEAPVTAGITVDGLSNDISLNIFKHYIPSKNTKIHFSSNIRRRITLKDLIYYLEGERKTPLQNLILHKAIIKLNQSSY